MLTNVISIGAGCQHKNSSPAGEEFLVFFLGSISADRHAVLERAIENIILLLVRL
jgi:hypothetical protein